MMQDLPNNKERAVSNMGGGVRPGRGGARRPKGGILGKRVMSLGKGRPDFHGSAFCLWGFAGF